jgi:hypothetical protein
MVTSSELFTMNKMLAILLLCLFLAPAHAAKPIKFSSAYTDLSKDCQFEDDSDLQEGTDAPLRCKGPGAYRLFIFFSASSNILTVEKGSSNETLDFQIEIPDFEKAKIEWRLADGVPFAVIARSGSPVGNSSKTLEARGLTGFENIEISLNPKKVSNTNQEVRKQVDAAYLKIKKS